MKIVFLGAPGSGKGTQALKIATRYSIPRLSTGDIIRDAIKDRSELGIKVAQIVRDGFLVSDDLVTDLVANELKKDICTSGFILDGYPRTLSQAKSLDDLLSKGEDSNLFIINLVVDHDELIIRISGRFFCGDCGASYHKSYNTLKFDGICNDCGSGNMKQRDDDKEEVIHQRLEVYKESTYPLLDYYRSKESGVKFLEIDGMKDSDEVFADIVARISIPV